LQSSPNFLSDTCHYSNFNPRLPLINFDSY
jgi:hypothetical protein